MRRRALLSTIGAIGLAGCTGANLDLFSGSSATTSDGTTIQFSRGISEPIRERCLRVFERTMSLTGATPSDGIRVTQKEQEETQYSHPIGYAQLAATAPNSNLWVPQDTYIPGTLGSYTPEKRRLVFADPAGLPMTLFRDIDGIPEISLDEFPTDPFLAHEFTHVIANDIVNQQASPTSVDATAAVRGVTEGTAEYIARRYHTACTDGEYDPCATRHQFPDPNELPLWVVPARLPYVNGVPFVREVIQRTGWDGLWDLHESPPQTAAEIMFPDRYFNGEQRWEDIEAQSDAGGQWRQIKSSRMGVHYLYVLFRALSIVPAMSSSTAVSASLTEETGLQHCFRAEMLRQWRGDRMNQYMNEDNRTGYYWETKWSTSEKAGTIADAVANRHDEQGEPYKEGWHVGTDTSEVYVTVSQSNSTVIFAMAPSQTDMSNFY